MRNLSDLKVQKMYDFLEEMYIECSNTPKQLKLSNKIIQLKFPPNLLSKLKDKGYITISGNHNQKNYNWIGKEPNMQIAETIYNLAMDEMSKYKSDKARELSIRKAGGNNSTVRYGGKTYIRVIKANKPKEVIEKLTTVTEFKIDNFLKHLSIKLEKSNIISFSDYCTSKHISEHFENAMISLGVIKKIDGIIKLSKDRFTPNDIKEIIKVQRNYKENQLDTPKIIEEFTPITKATVSKNKCFEMLNELYSDICQNKQIKSLSSYAKKYNINKSLPYKLIDLNILHKNDDNTYTWKNDKPTIETAKSIIKLVNMQTSKSKENNKREQHIIEPTICEIYKTKTNIKPKEIKENSSDKDLTKIIALKLIKLGELSEANILLDKLLNN